MGVKTEQREANKARRILRAQSEIRKIEAEILGGMAGRDLVYVRDKVARLKSLRQSIKDMTKDPHEDEDRREQRRQLKKLRAKKRV